MNNLAFRKISIKLNFMEWKNIWMKKGWEGKKREEKNWMDTNLVMEVMRKTINKFNLI